MSRKTPTAGLYQKFDVTRIVGWDKPGEEFFVLSPTHDPMARRALLRYAEECLAAGLDDLGRGIIAGLDRCSRGEPFYEKENHE